MSGLGAPDGLDLHNNLDVLDGLKMLNIGLKVLDNGLKIFDGFKALINFSQIG